MSIIKYKAESRGFVNNNLILVAFTLFTLITTLNPILLKNSFLALQLTLSIPFLMASIFSRTRLYYAKKNIRLWEKHGFITFLVGYSFLVNVVGILLTTLFNLYIGLVFFISNIVLAVSYSIIEVLEDKSKIKGRFYKDLFFTLMLVLLGIIPSLYYIS